MQASLWFVPTVVVVLSIAAALLLVELSGLVGDPMVERWPRVFGAGAEGSRGMLSAIATSMITVAGVVFSITIVALSMTAAQYSPRVLRNFMSDRPTQLVLGVFVGCFAYCLVVLRTIREDDDLGDFLPALAVLGGMAYALVGIAYLIFFIHHVAQGIQASFIAARIADEVDHAVEHMFPDDIGRGEDPPLRHAPTALPQVWVPVKAAADGYVVAVDGEPLLDFACKHHRIVRLRPAIGDFVIRDSVIIEVGGPQPLGDDDAQQLLGCVSIDRQRTAEQDPSFGIQQLVDVAVKALSPGINDPTTAALCIDRLTAVLSRLAVRRIPDPYRMAGGQLRVIAPAPDFRALVILSFGAIIHHARKDPLLLARMLERVRDLGTATKDPARRRAVVWVATAIGRALADPSRSSQLTLARWRARALSGDLRKRQT
jgi:uncharacterized membrane protein